MIFSPSDVRLAIRNPSRLVQRRLDAQRPSETGFAGDPTAVKLESLLRKYHRGLTIGQTVTAANESFRTWLANPRMQTRAHHALEMLHTYLNYDAQFPGGEIIEVFRRSEVEIGRHTVRTRRDVLFFGLGGHKLRNISWTRDRLDLPLLHLLMCPVVLSADQDLGEGRLQELQYWQVRVQQIDTLDFRRVSATLPTLRQSLDQAASLLQRSGVAG